MLELLSQGGIGIANSFAVPGFPTASSATLIHLRFCSPSSPEDWSPPAKRKGSPTAYSPLPLAPVLASLDARPPARFYDNKGYVIAYKPIKVHWYIYYEQW